MSDEWINRSRVKRWLKIVPVLAILATAGCAAANDQQADIDTPANGYEQPTEANNDANNGQGNEATSEDEVKVTAVSFETKQLALAPGEAYELKPMWSPASASDTVTPVFHSSDTRIASIDENGQLSIPADAVTGEQALITVQADDVQTELTVTVKTRLTNTAEPGDDGFLIVTNPAAYDVVVNKQRRLPDGYFPEDLAVPDVPFSFSGESEKKQLRSEAAAALEELFAQAEEDEIALRAVSGFRSFGTQHAIFQYNVEHQGEEEARRYSAYPGTSEHQTGLAMDVSSPSVNNALEDTLGDTEEGMWLARHAADFGFIIRYPEGKEHITGYAYEPWHLRYVGKQVAEQIGEQGITLEEYFAANRPNPN